MSATRTSKLHLLAFAALVLATIVFIIMLVRQNLAYAAYGREFSKLSMVEITAVTARIDDMRIAAHRWLVCVLAPLDALTFVLAIRARRRYGGASGILVAIACGWLAVALAVMVRSALVQPGGA